MPGGEVPSLVASTERRSSAIVPSYASQSVPKTPTTTTQPNGKDSLFTEKTQGVFLPHH